MLIFINKHFNTFLIFNLSISQKVKGAKMENLKTQIYFNLKDKIDADIKIDRFLYLHQFCLNQGIFMSKSICRQPSVCVLNVFTLLKGF